MDVVAAHALCNAARMERIACGAEADYYGKSSYKDKTKFNDFHYILLNFAPADQPSRFRDL